jgi:threonine dehydrogenase-like Zn-dependent dehydrogenase
MQARSSRAILKAMKAVAVFPTQRKVQLLDHPEPKIAAPTQAKMRVLEVGVCGTDREIVSFQYGTPPDGFEYLVLGHESLSEVVEVGSQVSKVRPGDLVVMTVRRPCANPSCIACREGRQDFCYTGEYTERGIKRQHGFMTELVVEEERYLNVAPPALRDVAVLVEPLTIAEKSLEQLSMIQQRLPWACSGDSGRGPARRCRAVVLGAGPVGLLGAMALRLWVSMSRCTPARPSTRRPMTSRAQSVRHMSPLKRIRWKKWPPRLAPSTWSMKPWEPPVWHSK